MSSPRPVVHLEPRTGDHARASAFYAKLLCWRRELTEAEAGAGSCLALGLGGGFGGGIVECGTARPLWLPCVQADQIEEPAGRRRVISAPQCGKLAIWQPKPRRPSLNTGRKPLAWR